MQFSKEIAPRCGVSTPFNFATHEMEGEAFLLTVGAFLLTVKFLCLQSPKAPY